MAGDTESGGSRPAGVAGPTIVYRPMPPLAAGVALLLGITVLAGWLLGLPARARLGRGERFDVILCDLMMPVMTGMELYDELGRVAPEQRERVVFLTGGAFTPTARSFLSQVPNPRLEKPFDVDELLAVVATRLAS
ncbi:MAG: response regulator [Deltaproteobacteria bacterium]|nr:response regulator [Deltaproteobacteria bacterium]